jgi:hypothetical protein
MRAGSMLRVGAVVTLALGATLAAAAPAAAGTLDTVGATAVSATDTSDVKSATAYCPTGTRVLGGGAVMGGNVDVHITGMLPDPVADSFTAYAAEHGPQNFPWYVRAYAICAPEPPGLVYVAAFTGGDSAPSRSDYAWCPAGRKVLGVGARVTAADSRKVFLTYVKPTGTGNGAETGAVEMAGGYAGNWWLHSWAVCATEPAGWDVVAAANDPGDQWAAFLCPFPKRLTGGGAYISLSLGQVYLTKIRIDSWVDGADVFPGGVAAEALTLDHSPDRRGHDWYIKAYGVCVD